MKVLGISFGRIDQRSDVMVKEALFAAKEALQPQSHEIY